MIRRSSRPARLQPHDQHGAPAVQPRQTLCPGSLRGTRGLDVAAHTLDIPSFGIEWDKSACLTRYAAGLDTLHADVSAVRRDAFESLPPEINVLAGGPPCQTYSVAGHGAGREALEEVEKYIDRLMAGDSDEEIDRDLRKFSNDQRTGLILEPLRYAIQATRSPNRANRPYDVIVLEQVPTVEPVWEQYAKALRDKGLPDGTKYEVAFGVLATETYGVPQTRSRAVLIARRVGLGEPELPPPTHHAYEPKKWNQRNAPAESEVHQPTLDDDSPAPEAAEHPEKTNTDLKPWRSMGDVLHEPVGTRTKRFWCARTTAAPGTRDDAGSAPTSSRQPPSPAVSPASWSSNTSMSASSRRAHASP